MLAEVISVGTELLLGQILDTNSKYIAEKLTGLGYDIHYLKTVGDNKQRLIYSLKQALNRADIVITTGGLGPTEDDLTRQVLAEALDENLYLDESLAENIEDYFEKRGYDLTKNNYSQAYLPEGAEAIKNYHGTAPGIIYTNDSIVVISLPGVPIEMKSMFEDKVIPYLQNLNNEIIVSRTLNLFGIGESTLESKIYDILQSQSNPTLALLAGKGEVNIRITAKGNDKEKIEELITEKENQLRDRIGRYIYGVDNCTLPGVVGNLLMERKLTLSVAESCTGGLLGHRITQIPGSSSYYLGGTISYSNEAKINLLDIEESLLKTEGAVSDSTAREMAKGVKDLFSSDIGIGITGIAGPGGGTPEKPVGLVYVSISYEDINQVWKLNLKGERKFNKWMSTQYVLYYLMNLLRSSTRKER